MKLSEDDYMYMSNVSYKVTGIVDIVLWLGFNSLSETKHIYVNNIPNSFRGDDVFEIIIPNLDIIGDVNNTLISDNILDDIKQFILLNIDVITEYSNCLMTSDELIHRLKPIKKLT